MKKILFILALNIFALNIAFAQNDMGDFVPGSEEVSSAYFGSLCANIPLEEDRMMCSNDQLDEYIASLGTPAIVETKNIKATVVVYFDLDASGNANNIKIKKSSGNTELDNIVLEHFKKMPAWIPMTIDGFPIESPNMNLKYSFKPSAK